MHERESRGTCNIFLFMPGPYDPEESGLTGEFPGGEGRANGMWHHGVCHCRFQTLSQPQSPQESFSCPGSQGSQRPHLSPGRAHTMFTWELDIKPVCGSTPMERARLCPVEPAGCGDIRSPVYHPICPSRGYASSLWGLWALTGKPGAGSRKVDFRLLRCLHRPQAKLC